MPSRAAVHTLLEEDPELLSLGVQTVYGSNAVDTPGEDFFLVVRWENTVRAYKTTGSSRCSVWAHDKQRDYERINSALRRVRDLLTSTVHRAGEDGWVMTSAEWNGEGPDLYDGGFGTIARYADFTVVSRYTTT